MVQPSGCCKNCTTTTPLNWFIRNWSFKIVFCDSLKYNWLDCLHPTSLVRPLHVTDLNNVNRHTLCTGSPPLLWEAYKILARPLGLPYQWRNTIRSVCRLSKHRANYDQFLRWPDVLPLICRWHWLHEPLEWGRSTRRTSEVGNRCRTCPLFFSDLGSYHELSPDIWCWQSERKSDSRTSHTILRLSQRPFRWHNTARSRSPNTGCCFRNTRKGGSAILLTFLQYAVAL